MSANINDYFTKTFTTDSPSGTTVTAVRASGASTLSCQQLNWPTDTAVHYATYVKDTVTKEPKPGTVKFWKGVVSGNSIISVTPRFTGTDPGNDIGDIVVMGPSGSWADDLVAGILVAHDQSGNLKSTVRDGIVSDAISSGKTASNLRIKPRISSTASTSALTPNIDAVNIYDVTALAENLAIASPTGTPYNGDVLVFRLKDNGTAHSITISADFVNISGLGMPTTTTAGAWTVIGCMYSSTDGKWQVISITPGA